LLVIPEGNLRFDRFTTTDAGEHQCQDANITSGFISSPIARIFFTSGSQIAWPNALLTIAKKTGSFTARYKITRLVYFERFQYINNAIARETELKHWTRAQKIALIEAMNPTWEELMPNESVAGHTFETQIPFGNDNQGKANA
jgi:hypothetical protein